MFCRRCGGDKFDENGICLRCGWSKAADVRAREAADAQIPQGGDPQALFYQTQERVSPGITKGKDGVLRWMYELSMWSNPTVLITTAKVLGVACLGTALIFFFIGLGNGFLDALQFAGIVLAIVTGIFAVLLLLSYPLLALLYGGRYTAVFEMDESGVTHNQDRSQQKRARTIAILGLALSILNRSPGGAAASYSAAARTSSHSEFAKVKKAVVVPRRHVIYLNMALSRNQVYIAPEDFDFVCGYILSHLSANANIVHK